jgi:hypothetical protein
MMCVDTHAFGQQVQHFMQSYLTSLFIFDEGHIFGGLQHIL